MMREHRAGDQHVVEVGDDEIGVLVLESTGVIASISPEKPPMVNSTRKASANSIGVSKVIEPRHMVATQLNTFTPVGTAISMVAYMKNSSPGHRHAGGEHVVRPDDERQEGDRGRGIDHRGVAEQRLAREGRDDLETMPKAGRIMMYTSGWPKNQKMCWNITGSPPPAA
jgi:hypothetical protein